MNSAAWQSNVEALKNRAFTADLRCSPPSSNGLAFVASRTLTGNLQVEDPLAPPVRAILAHLAHHPRRVISVDELRDVGWHGSNRKPRRIAHYIAQARRALGDDAREPKIIRTIYGVGYQYIGTSHLS